MLSYLHITVNESPSQPDAFRPPKILEEMVIEGFNNVNPLEEEENQNCQTKSLHELSIMDSNCFFSDGPTKELALGFWKYFEALESLYIWFCDLLFFWPEQEFKSLKRLKYLNIRACYNLTGSLQELSSPISSEEDSLPHLESLQLSSPTTGREDSLPHLELLFICHCPQLVEVPVHSKSIKHLIIDSCPELSWEDPTNLIDLTELRTLEIRNADKWIAWPNNMEHLPFLERLHISNCQGLESFPEALQQRLSSLQRLEIDGCPTLERRCRRGGDYWHLVSPIAEKNFPIEAGKNTKWKSFSRRLLCIRGR
ncbi:NBS-LRR-like resistance protein [Rhynchospora pubera]|uniref:NBS-LRR-like resistance protein n=1 Tax=Rhynchospora pubera TaxID=906938 RepID=A0AAV8D8M8_9POAL|nr:NBS-LRR-like resistance protein [Rhynchospora pubera]